MRHIYGYKKGQEAFSNRCAYMWNDLKLAPKQPHLSFAFRKAIKTLKLFAVNS